MMGVMLFVHVYREPYVICMQPMLNFIMTAITISDGLHYKFLKQGKITDDVLE